MQIGEAAQRSGVSAKMIRYYESIDLIAPGKRSDAGYRIYANEDVHTLRFIKRARKLGFSLEQIRELVSLWQDPHRASADVREITRTHVAALELRIREMTDMRDTLINMAEKCCGDERAECPILQELAASEESV